MSDEKTGMVKAKKYDWKDSNLALFGSDTEKSVKKESAQHELAWKNAGRRSEFKYGVSKNSRLFIGPGKITVNSTTGILISSSIHTKRKTVTARNSYTMFTFGLDEYGTAAYKTVELDHYLDDKPIQHREVMKHESELFKTYFLPFSILNGGADSGFRHVGPKTYQPRLLHFYGKSRYKIIVKERPLSRRCLTDDDVFILDNGLNIYQWNGSESSKDERIRAMQYISNMKAERGRAISETLDSKFTNPKHKFFTLLPDIPVDEEDEADANDDSTPTLFRLSNDGGNLSFTGVASGALPLPRAKLDSGDVFVADAVSECFVWIGNGADSKERQNAMAYAHSYLSKSKHPLIPITVVSEGRESESFLKVVA
ncbi:putative gelsolin-like protein 2 [Apostichopus japonicus]|uniref:Putative gelsolin-like protein 2 n=1 Tax=Stichopus japonicus TaxID=307972 RepID=A0A2G8KPB2_STIJA|nr:putative gelsolin-like protein 2 [Apostichopus japonicus]